MTTTSVSRDLLLALDCVTMDREVRESVQTDRSGIGGALPDAVAKPRTVAEVQEVVRAASATRTPLVPRGAGTGLAGGASATPGSVVLDLSALNHIVSIDPVRRLAVVEPGVITAHLDRAAARHGLRYAPDPASAEISTIGGNIATNAGGLRCVKYGVTRDAVRSLDVVLANGDLITTGAITAKSTVGYDLTGLFVGSEGTLGFIVGATLALKPLPQHTGTLVARFASLAEASRAVKRILAAGVDPAVVELLDAATVAEVHRFLGAAAVPEGQAMLLVQAEHTRDASSVAADLSAIAAAIGPDAVIEVTDSAQQAEELLRVRRSALPALEAIGVPYIEDICVPVDRLAEAVEGVAEIAQRRGVRIFTFAHAGDGNLHPIIVGRFDGADTDAVHAAAHEIFALALELDGTVAGEHGVGVLKREWAHRELSPAVIAVNTVLRDALDPHHILNPGKTS